jgi:type IV pilus assembly protein PilW
MKRLARGLSLIELMIALVIGSVLIVGAVYVYSQSRTTSMVNDTIARLQENGRYALSVIEPDVQLAGYYGFTNSPDDFGFISGGGTATVTPTAQMTYASGAVAGLPGSAQTCRNNYAVNLLQAVDGFNNQTAFGLACAAQGGGLSTATAGNPGSTDLLTIRRSSNPPAVGVIAPQNGRLQLLVNRLSPTSQFIFADGALPATPALDANNVQVRNLIVRSYYISANSTGQVGLPALRVKVLSTAGGSPAFVDDNTVDATSGEVLAGVQDMQVQFGIDTGDYNADGVIDPGLDEDGNNIPDAPRGIATRYVNPDFPNIERYQVVSVRIWLLLRAAQQETGFRDTRTYQYADRPAYTPNDSFRRVLVSKTIQLRNSRTF